MENLKPVVDLVGRILLSVLFIPAGVSKITGYAGVQGYMESMGVPGMLLPLVILLEIGGGLAILFGWQTRIAAILMAGFSILAGLIFHMAPGDQVAMVMLMKNLAVAGGFLVLAANGAGRWSLDARLRKTA
ncbi:MAG: DoxX family protein [Alphaproteobacteria bacterium]|nr:MAG: DoxX family protein [Alphaproteobacteria bacterium]